MSAFWWHPFIGSMALWWLTVTLLGWLCFPLLFRCACLLPDRGFAISKAVGLALVAFLYAFFALGRGDALRDGSASIPPLLLLACIALLISNAILFAKSYRAILRFARSNWKLLLGYEIAGLLCFVGYLWIRSYIPDATFDALGWYGAEKWVNLTILTSLWRNPVIPPIDPWLSGQLLNYYYFSHLAWALVARIAAVPPQLAFNLALATLFSLTATASFAAGHALSERKRGGFWALVLVLFAGVPAAWVQVKGLIVAWRSSGLGTALASFDFWRPSDVIPNTRNEFPAFNWLLGDLHAHGFGQLLLLAFISLLVNTDRVRQTEQQRWHESIRQGLPSWGLMAVLLACMWAANSWDFLIAALLGVLWVLVASLRMDGSREKLAQLVQGLLVWAIMMILAVLFLSAFYSHYTYPPVVVRNPNLAKLPSVFGMLGSIGIVSREAWTTLNQWLAFWGFLAVPFALALATRWFPGRSLGSLSHFLNSHKSAIIAAAILFLVIAASYSAVIPFTALLLIFFSIIAVTFLLSPGVSETGEWVALLASTALICQLMAELIFLDDPIASPYDRYNTVFKFYYSVWPVAALAGALLLSRMGYRDGDTDDQTIPFRTGKWLRLFVHATLLAAVFLYPVLGAASRIQAGRNRLQNLVDNGMEPTRARSLCRTLDGLAFLHLPRYDAADDLNLALWMRENLTDADVIVEITGVSYSMIGRYAAISGIPSFMGWTQHQAQWRGAPFESIYPDRMQVLDTIYRSSDAAETRRVIRENNLPLVVVGKLERAALAPDVLAKIERIGRPLHRSGQSVLYRIDPDDIPHPD